MTLSKLLRRVFPMFFIRTSKYEKQLKKLEETKLQLSTAVQEGLEIAEQDINNTRTFFEKMKNNGIRRFDCLLNLCLYSAVTNVDLMLLTNRIRQGDNRFDKLLNARFLAIIIIEYLKDINTLLGYKLIGELNSNGYTKLVPSFKDINSKLSKLRKRNATSLTHIRNNVSAHKTNNALNLVNYIYNIDPDEMYNLALEVIEINTQLTNETTKVYYQMLDEANLKKAAAENNK